MRARLRRSQIAGVAVGGVLLSSGIALAIGVGLQNPSFENGLDNWHAKSLNENRDVVYSNQVPSLKGAPMPGCDAPDAYNMCVVEGNDTFEVSDSRGTRNVSVSPLHGTKMLRVGGPFHDDSESQSPDHTFVAEQTFTVDSGNPVVTMNYNFFTYDYSGYDELRLIVRITDDEGDQVSRVVQGGFGQGGDTNLKTTGWVGVPFDLTPYAGQAVNLALEVVGTEDHLYGTWGYFDAGQAPAPPINAAGASGQAPAGVHVNKQVNGGGQLSFSMANSEVSNAGEGGCIDLVVDLPINAGTSALSNIQLRFRNQLVTMTPLGGNLYRATIEVCAFEGGDLVLEYDATEEGVTQHFVVTIGQIVLIDPQGVVYDVVEYGQAVTAGQSAAQARATAAIEGATVRLQRKSGQNFLNVLSADPGIAPNVNPQATDETGLYQWDVSAGIYRVVVSMPGYVTKTSQPVTIPPPVLDLHIPLTPLSCLARKASLGRSIAAVGRQIAATAKSLAAARKKVSRAKTVPQRNKAKRRKTQLAKKLGAQKRKKGTLSGQLKRLPC